MAVGNRRSQWHRTLVYLLSVALVRAIHRETTALVPPRQPPNVRRPHPRCRLPHPSSNLLLRRRRNRRQELRLKEAPDSDLSTSNPRNIFVIDWDGCLADTRAWRSSLALSVAQTAWPDLREKILRVNKSSSSSLSWLCNKLNALSHVFYSDGTASLTCEYALAARLLLDEQQLDQGRSRGATGKYASKFHPRGNSDSNDDEPPRRRQMEEGSTGEVSSTGSRPLTVGEIAANWDEGGMIRDTLLVRYHCSRKFPLPILQEILDRHLCTSNGLFDSTHPRPRLLPELQQDLLSAGSDRTILVAVRHASDLPMAVEALACAGLPCRIAPSLHDVQRRGLSVLVRSKSTVRDVLEAVPAGTHVYVLSSCWTSLQSEIVHYGDDVPVRRRDRNDQPQHLVGPTPYGSLLCLGYAQWAPNTHPSLHATATMNPWTTLVSLQELEELLSFRIISPGSGQ